MIRTYTGQAVDVGDTVVYLMNVRTGTSTIRKCVCTGIAYRQTKSKVFIMCTRCDDRPDQVGIGADIFIYDVICKIEGNTANETEPI